MMTDDEILLLADQYTENRYVRTVTKEMMIEFAKAIAAKEREACIDIVAMNGGSVEIEAHIRQRGGSDD